jgi:hypothetical protein
MHKPSHIHEFAIVVAVLIGAIVGYLIGGGRASLPAILADPETLTANTSATLCMIGGALILPWAVNRWIEHRPGKPSN